MPELPEIETVRSQLATVLPGQTVASIEVRTPKVIQGDIQKLVGEKVTKLRRYGKMLVVDFSHEFSLAIHFKMSGRLVYDNAKLPTLNPDWDVQYSSDRHTHLIIHFKNQAKLYYHDYRRFGWVKLIKTSDIEKMSYVTKLGPEFFRNLTEKQFIETLGKNRRPVKLVLMDQETMAGIGNIYANDSLWCAKIYPKTKANAITTAQAKTLFACIEKNMKQAIKWGGASENAYRDAFGLKGQVQEHFSVYAREGEPCLSPACRQAGVKIQKFMLGSRGTFICPNCQR